MTASVKRIKAKTSNTHDDAPAMRLMEEPLGGEIRKANSRERWTNIFPLATTPVNYQIFIFSR